MLYERAGRGHRVAVLAVTRASRERGHKQHLIGGLVSQQLANDPGGQRWRRLIPRVISMFADDLDLP